MCCWCLKVFFRVLVNLTGRLVENVAYETSSKFRCCCSASSDVEKEFDENDQEELEEFFQSVSRRSVEILLENKQNGTFIIRPSKNSDLGTLSVVQDDKVFHLCIRKRSDGMVSLGSEKVNEKCFRNLDSLINYYISNYLMLYSDGQRVRENHQGIYKDPYFMTEDMEST